MTSKLCLCCVAGLLTLALFPCSTQAQGRRAGIVQSPFGPLYDTRSPEWRMAGGDMMLYQQIMEQKMMLRQQQMFIKQQQLLMKQQKSGKKGTQTSPSLNLNPAAVAGFGNDQQPGTAPTYRRRSKLRGTSMSGTSTSTRKRGTAKASIAKKPGASSSATAKSAEPSSSPGTQTPEP
jgi:transcription initiation factor TFIID subunit TAF12